MLMHIKYEVTLPDHDFVVAPKHKLIPSIIGDMKLVKGKNLVNDAFRCNLFRCFIHRYQTCQAFSIICICSFPGYDEAALSA